MELNEETISVLNQKTLFDRETLYSLYEIEEEEERVRIGVLLLIKAKEFGLEREWKKVLRSYDAAEQKLAEEYEVSNRANPFGLEYTAKNVPSATVDNFLRILRNESCFSGMKFNLLTEAPEIADGTALRRWVDADDAWAKGYIEKHYSIYSQQKFDDALRIFFRERAYHPIKQMIESVVWDGKERISEFLIRWLKCKDDEYAREVSRMIFAGGINRIYRPGCKFDEMPVLIGTRQGEGKSTFVRWMALEDRFFREVTEIEGQKGMEAIEGGWICEVSELLALTKIKETEAVKSYLTRLSDIYRKPFDKRVTEHPRQCIFIGTTNREQFLTDKTGNRRFLPIQCHQSGYDLFECEQEIKAEILQCWAEAKVKFDKGEMKPYIRKELRESVREKQLSSVEDDYREGLIFDYLSDKEEVCLIELWQNALGNCFSKPSRKESNDIALILQGMQEWCRMDKSKRMGRFGAQKYWKRKDARSSEKDEKLPFEA